MKTVLPVLLVGIVIGYVLGRLSGSSSVPSPADEKGRRDLGQIKESVVTEGKTPGPAPSAVPETATATVQAEAPLRQDTETLPRNVAAVKVRPDTIAGIRDPAEVSRFLDETREPNLFDVVRISKPFERMNEELTRLNGRFVGDVKFFDDPDKRWDVVLEAHLQIEGKKLKGTTLITLSEKGKTFSQLDGNGPMEDYRSLRDEAGILVKAAPDTYFQLYYLPKLDAFAGNYYKQNAPDKILPRGLIRLERQ